MYFLFRLCRTARPSPNVVRDRDSFPSGLSWSLCGVHVPLQKRRVREQPESLEGWFERLWHHSHHAELIAKLEGGLHGRDLFLPDFINNHVVFTFCCVHGDQPGAPDNPSWESFLITVSLGSHLCKGITDAGFFQGDRISLEASSFIKKSWSLLWFINL